MQSLQADQSLYNHKGVWYILLSNRSFSGDKKINLLICDRKYTKNINISSQNQEKSYLNSPKHEKRGKWRGIALCNDEKGDSIGIVSLLIDLTNIIYSNSIR